MLRGVLSAEGSWRGTMIVEEDLVDIAHEVLLSFLAASEGLQKPLRGGLSPQIAWKV